VAGNELTSIPGSVAKLKNLAVLDARFNNLAYDVTNWPEEWNWLNIFPFKFEELFLIELYLF